jgi:hypothetical protein
MVGSDLDVRAQQLRRGLLATASVQLGASIVGLVVCVRRRHPYHFLFLHGRPDRVGREALRMGTALSAPVSMLLAEGRAIVALTRGEGGRPERVLMALGTAMVPGYLGESLVRRRLRPSGFDAVETPLAVIGIGSAAAMAALGWACGRSSREP